MRSINIKITLIMLVFIIFSGSIGLCSQAAAQKYLTIPYTGTVRIPANLEYVQFKISAEMLDKQTKKQEELIKQQAGLLAQKVKYKRDTDIEFYQLALDDGDSYHAAMLFFVHDRSKLTDENAKFFSKLLTYEQKQELSSIMSSPKVLDEFNRGLQEGIAKGQNTKKTNPDNFRMKVTGVGPVSFPVMNNKQIYSGGIRLLISSDSAILPVYLCGYNLPSENFAFAGLACMDSERDFWSAFMDNMMVTFVAEKL